MNIDGTLWYTAFGGEMREAACGSLGPDEVHVNRWTIVDENGSPTPITLKANEGMWLYDHDNKAMTCRARICKIEDNGVDMIGHSRPFSAS